MGAVPSPSPNHTIDFLLQHSLFTIKMSWGRHPSDAKTMTTYRTVEAALRPMGSGPAARLGAAPWEAVQGRLQKAEREARCVLGGSTTTMGAAHEEIIGLLERRVRRDWSS